MKQDVYLGAIGYKLGQPYPITEIEGADPDQVDLFKHLGLQNYCRTDKSIGEMAYLAVKDTLSQVDIAREDVASLILATTVDSINSVGIEYPEMDRILENFGLINAKLYGCSLSKCSNLSAALELAVSLLVSQDLPHVLVVLADKYSEKSNRFMDSNESILSDGAVSFLVSRDTLEFKLIHLATRNDLSHVEREYNVFEFLDNSVNHLNILWQELQEAHAASSFTKHFFGNYNQLLQRSYMSKMEIEQEKLFLDNLAKYGHVFSGDTLINLKDYNNKMQRIPAGTKFACYTVGYFRWGCFALQSVAV